MFLFLLFYGSLYLVNIFPDVTMFLVLLFYGSLYFVQYFSWYNVLGFGILFTLRPMLFVFFPEVTLSSVVWAAFRNSSTANGRNWRHLWRGWSRKRIPQLCSPVAKSHMTDNSEPRAQSPEPRARMYVHMQSSHFRWCVSGLQVYLRQSLPFSQQDFFFLQPLDVRAHVAWKLRSFRSCMHNAGQDVSWNCLNNLGESPIPSAPLLPLPSTLLPLLYPPSPLPTPFQSWPLSQVCQILHTAETSRLDMNLF